MSEPFIAEIRIFAGSFAPQGWAFCNGQLLPIAQNTALFSLVGTIYGGDGRTTFALPNLQGRVPMHPGQGPGLSDYQLGQSAGQETATLSIAQLPTHTHTQQVSGDPAGSGVPSAASVPAKSATSVYGPAADLEPMAATTGGGQAHDNHQPYLGLNFIIALVGIYPPRS